MKNRIVMLLALLAIGTSCTKDIAEERLLTQEQEALMVKLVGGTEGEIVPGTLLIKLDENTAGMIGKGESWAISSIVDGSDITSISPAILTQPKNPGIARKYGLHQWYMVNFDDTKRPQQIAEQLASNRSITAIQYNNYINRVVSDKVVEFIPAPVSKSDADNADAVFNDPYLTYQWNLINTGDKTIAANAVAGADVGVADAWRLTGGDPSVIVAVFDCAVNSMHEDLKDALWINEAEKNGEPNVDDDGNGFIDDKYGFNFVGCTKIDKDFANNLLDGNQAEAIKGNLLNWTGGSGHGTHVAGIIGAVNGNGKGVSSIAGGTGNGDGVRLMSCQIFDGNASGSDAQNAAAYIYAADNGACIAQCSYGSNAVITTDKDYINGNDGLKINGSPLEYAALMYFLDPENSNHPSLRGNMAVFAAGNHKNPYSSYPGALSSVLSVTAFGADFLPGGYTNYGPGCNISAPGGEYYDENNYGMMILSTGVSNAAQSSPGINGNRNYVYMQGTSMACPHVSGVVALGISYAHKLGKEFTNEDFTSLLLSSVNDIDQYMEGDKKYYDLSSYSWIDLRLDTYKGQMGTGAVDAWKFLMAIEGTPSVMVKAGEKAVINLADYCNPNGKYALQMDEASKTSLGISGEPVIKDGKLEITCTAIGAGKITLTSSVGKDPEMENGIGGMDYSRTISIVSRPFATNNGGWF